MLATLLGHLINLRYQNRELFFFGLACLGGGIICLALTQITTTQVLGINAYWKPAKFFLSTWIFVWTMAFYLQFLPDQSLVRVYNWVVILGLTFELWGILHQASQGRLSHFNMEPGFGKTLFNLMFLIIVTVVLFTGVMSLQFFTQRITAIPPHIVAAIQLGIIVCVVFSLLGGMMGARLQHTIGAPDGGAGLPLVNWSRQHGDLRVMHFLGIHALQIIPLLAFFIARTPLHSLLIALGYTSVVVFSLVQALAGKPLISY
jgi:hypothetical protein